jgi:hypothetical protein
MPINAFSHAVPSKNRENQSFLSLKLLMFFLSDTIKALFRAFFRPNLNQKQPETHSK